MRLVGVEEHFLSDDVKREWDSVDLARSDPSLAFNSGEIGRRLRDLADGRIALMDETGVDVQVLSLTTPGLQPLGVRGPDLARRTNDLIANVIAGRPDRFQAFATVAMAAPDEAAAELERCIRTLGFRGLMLHGRVGARHLDDPIFLPVFERAAALCVPVFLHPQVPAVGVRAAYYEGFRSEVETAFATYGIGWHYDAGVEFLRLVLSGLFDRLPGLQIILGHWGELVIFYADRLAAFDKVAGLQRPMSTCLRENLHITASGQLSSDYLARAMAVVGPDRLLFSTDFPYQYRSGAASRRFVEDCGLDEAQRAAFASGNWERLTAAVPVDRGEGPGSAN